MRWTLRTAVTVGTMIVPLSLAGCTRKPPPAPPSAAKAEVYPRLKCPDNSQKVGAEPPEGFRVWCQTRLASGKFVHEGGEVTFHKTTGAVATEGIYSADKKQGTWLSFYDTTELHLEERFEDGRAQGLSTEYWPSGVKKAEGLKVDGYEDGAWNYWHENGQLFKQGSWEKREPNGTWIEYDPDGKPVRERQYMFGRMLSHKELTDE